MQDIDFTQIDIQAAAQIVSQRVAYSQLKNDDQLYRPIALCCQDGRNDAASLTFELDRDPELDRMLYDSFGFDMRRDRERKEKN